MSFATVADIQRLMAQFPITSSGKPTSTQIESILADTEHEVNTHLSSAGVTVPVTAPDYFLNWLGLLASYGATAAVLKSMFPNATGPAETPAYAFWEARYKLGLKGIDDGTLVPSDLITSHRVKPSTYFTKNPGGEESLGVHEPWFGRSFT